MSEIDRSSQRIPAAARPRQASSRLDLEGPADEAGLPEVVAWLTRYRVSLAAIGMIVVQLVWKASFLSEFYFRQDDIHFTELAVNNSLSWKYLSYVGSGHLHPGVLLIVWILARTAVYSWDAASAVTLVMLAIASLAAWWLLRTLIGNRPAMLIPLAIFLFSPLTFPNDSWWQSGIESLPLQAVIFLALGCHVHYVRTGRARYLVAAAVCLVVGLFFFEKAAIVPVLLFAVTAGFLVDGRLAISARTSLLRYWRAWALYVAIVAVYGVVLLEALRSSTVKAGSLPLASSLTFSGDLITHSLVPGLLGGPWNWFMSSDGAVAYAEPPSGLAWLAGAAVLAIIVTSVMTRRRAGRAWATLAIWVLLADVAPVLLGRVSSLGPGMAGLIGWDTRYVADAPAVAAVCVALAFWPVIRPQDDKRASGTPREFFTGPVWRAAAFGLTGVLLIGSVVTVHSYQSATRAYNFFGKYYLANARASLADVKPGSVIFNEDVPGYVMLGKDIYGPDSLQSAALGPMISSKVSREIRWTAHPSGTIDNLLMFGPGGLLHPAVVKGADSQSLPAGERCWPERDGRVVVRLAATPSPKFDDLMRIGYLAGKTAGGEDIAVSYGASQLQFVVVPGLHSVYLPVAGRANSLTLTVPGRGICIGDAEVGSLQPAP